MAHHVYEWDTPDCPVCGNEMTKRVKYVLGSQTENNPFGRREEYYICEYCKGGDDNG